MIVASVIKELSAICAPFFHYCDAKEISFYFFRDTKLCTKHKKTPEFHLYCWNHVCKVNKLRTVDCFHREYRVFIPIIVRDLCIVKCKKFSARGGLLSFGSFFRDSKYLR